MASAEETRAKRRVYETVINDVGLLGDVAVQVSRALVLSVTNRVSLVAVPFRVL